MNSAGRSTFLRQRIAPAIAVGTILGFSAFPESADAQNLEADSDAAKAFYQQVTGKWARIAENASSGLVEEQVEIAALQCLSARKIDPQKASEITSISGRISQQLSRLIVYQKLETGINRIDFGLRISNQFPNLKGGRTRGNRPGFEVSNDKSKINIAFGKLKQGNNRSIAVMIENKALFLKCPEVTPQ